MKRAPSSASCHTRLTSATASATVADDDERVAEAAKRLEAAFRWIDTNDGYPEDYRIIAAVALGLEPAHEDVENSMGLGWQD